MYGQMTAGSWIYIGTQGILQGTYETFAASAKKLFGGDLAGRLVVSGGLGGMGGAQPLAATMNNATFLGADVDRARIQKRLDTRYCDVLVEDLDQAIDQALEWKSKKVAKSIGVAVQRGRPARAPDRAQAHARRPDRPDQRARSAERLRAEQDAATRRRSRCARAIPSATRRSRSAR